jgi:hypothetical protein
MLEQQTFPATKWSQNWYDSGIRWQSRAFSGPVPDLQDDCFDADTEVSFWDDDAQLGIYFIFYGPDLSYVGQK